MLILLLKIPLLLAMLAIFYQDSKSREVYWWLFFLSGIGIAILHLYNVGWSQFLINVAVNCVLVGLILLVLWVYARFKLKSLSLNAVFGLGDILFLYVLAIGFSTISFITLFVFGLLFSLVMHLIVQYILPRKREEREMQSKVPLAGYLALFFVGILIVHWLGGYEDLYFI